MRVDDVEFVRFEDEEEAKFSPLIEEGDIEFLRGGGTIVYPENGVVVRWRGSAPVDIRGDTDGSS